MASQRNKTLVEVIQVDLREDVKPDIVIRDKPYTIAVASSEELNLANAIVQHAIYNYMDSHDGKHPDSLTITYIRRE